MVKRRTALANQIRGLLGEYGIVVGYGISQARRRIPQILEYGLTDRFRAWLAELLEALCVLDERIKQYDKEIEREFAANEACRRRGAMEGIGPQIATAVIATYGDSKQFGNGRHFAASMCIEDPVVTKRILDHLKHKAETRGSRALPKSRAPRLGCTTGCSTDEPENQ